MIGCVSVLVTCMLMRPKCWQTYFKQLEVPGSYTSCLTLVGIVSVLCCIVWFLKCCSPDRLQEYRAWRILLHHNSFPLCLEVGALCSCIFVSARWGEFDSSFALSVAVHRLHDARCVNALGVIFVLRGRADSVVIETIRRSCMTHTIIWIGSARNFEAPCYI